MKRARRRVTRRPGRSVEDELQRERVIVRSVCVSCVTRNQDGNPRNPTAVSVLVDVGGDSLFACWVKFPFTKIEQKLMKKPVPFEFRVDYLARVATELSCVK